MSDRKSCDSAKCQSRENQLRCHFLPLQTELVGAADDGVSAHPGSEVPQRALPESQLEPQPQHPLLRVLPLIQ